MGEIWAAVGASTTLLAVFMAYLASQIQHTNTRLDALDAKFTARLDAQSDRLDRVIEMLAQHEHR